MNVNYDKLWKLMINKKINKTQLCEKTGSTTNAMAKMRKDEIVKKGILIEICKVLECKLNDIVEMED